MCAPPTPSWVSHAYESLWKLLARALGVNVRFLARNATLVTVSHGVSVLRGLVTGYLVARLFPREMYGQYQFILSVVGAISIFGLPGISKALSRAIARGEKGIALPVLRWQFLYAQLGSLILLGIIPFLPQNQADLWPHFTIAALLFPIVHSATVLFGGMTIGKERFDLALRATMIASSATALAVFLILFLHPSVILLYVAVTALPALSYLWHSRKLLDACRRTPSIRHILHYGMSLTIITIPNALSAHLDKLLISATFGLNQLAVFSVALLIPEQIKVLVKELLPISFAIQAKGEDTPERRTRLIRLVGRSTLFFLIGILLYILIAPLAFTFLFPNYPEAVFLSQVFSVTLLTMPSALFMQYLEAQGMITELRKSQWISAGIFALATVILIPTFGLLGAVLARGTLRLAIALTTLFYLLRSSPQTSAQIS